MILDASEDTEWQAGPSLRILLRTVFKDRKIKKKVGAQVPQNYVIYELPRKRNDREKERTSDLFPLT